MNWFKTKRECQLEELVEAYRTKLEAIPKASKVVEFVNVPVPQAEDMPEYWRKIAALVDDPFYLFWLVQLRRSIVDDFETSGSDKAEYYRGKLAMIGEIISDSRKAKNAMNKQVANEI